MGFVYSTCLDSATGTQVTNSATAIYTNSLGEDVFVSAIVLTNTTAAKVPVTCGIYDGNTAVAGYRTIREANSCIVPYIDGTDYKLYSLTIEFPRPYRLQANHALYATAGAANGCTAIVHLAGGGSVV